MTVPGRASTRSFRAVFLGPPGAGKGTQAAEVSGSPEVAHLSTGDMLRKHVADGTPLGLQAKGYMAGGRLVPDDLIIAMVEEHLDRVGTGGSWILDGFPRTLPQAEALGRSLEERAAPLTHVVFLRVPTESLMKRLTGRRICQQCGAIWNVHLKPTAVEGVCDRCGGQLQHRSDDRPDAVVERLETYDKQTRPLLDHYRSEGCLVEIDADRSSERVTDELLDVLSREVC